MRAFLQAGRWLMGPLAALTACLWAQPNRGAEDQVKAAVVVQLARFVEWPAAVNPSHFRLCVLSKDRWIPLLEEAARGHTIGGKAITVVRLARPQDAAGCNVVVMGAFTGEQPWNGWMRDPVLSISEEPGFAASGGMIGLVVQGGKVGFELNTAAATRAGLTVSSKLIRLARLVGGRGN